MPHYYSKHIQKILICPQCGGSMQLTERGMACNHCQTIFGWSPTGSLDLRLQKPKHTSLTFELGRGLPDVAGVTFTPLTMNSDPAVSFEHIPFHLSSEIISHLPRAKTETSLMLDLGCGGAIHREVAEYAGYEYVGLDYDSPKAPILGDAHSLPFADNSFELIFSIAVLEHIRYPFVMMMEAYRVLQPGGKFIGTVAFLEPFHQNSYYHHSHLGTLNTISYPGFQIEFIAPHKEWTGLRAQAYMSLFKRLPRWMVQTIVAPTQLIQELWWALRQRKNRGLDANEVIRDTTGAFTFIASKGL